MLFNWKEKGRSWLPMTFKCSSSNPNQSVLARQRPDFRVGSESSCPTTLIVVPSTRGPQNRLPTSSHRPRLVPWSSGEFKVFWSHDHYLLVIQMFYSYLERKASSRMLSPVQLSLIGSTVYYKPYHQKIYSNDFKQFILMQLKTVYNIPGQ